MRPRGNSKDTIKEDHVPLLDLMTPECCSTLVALTVKYALYNSDQIPVEYSSLTRLVTNAREHINGHDGLNGFKDRRRRHQCQKFIEVFDQFEATFKNLQEELIHNRNVEEVLLFLGPTVRTPRVVLRIHIPNLAFDHKTSEHPMRLNLNQLFRFVMTSADFNSSFKSKLDPTSIFILLKLKGRGPLTEGFILKDNFTIPMNTPTSIFSLHFKLPPEVKCGCTPSSFDVFQDSYHSLNRSESTESSLGCSAIASTLSPSPTKISSETLSKEEVIETMANDLETLLSLSKEESLKIEPTNEFDDLKTFWYQNKISLKGFKDLEFGFV